MDFVRITVSEIQLGGHIEGVECFSSVSGAAVPLEEQVAPQVP